MTLGGRRVQVSRPRMRTSDDEHELPVQTYQYFADRDPLTRVVMDRVLAGVSARRSSIAPLISAYILAWWSWKSFRPPSMRKSTFPARSTFPSRSSTPLPRSGWHPTAR